MNWCSQIDSHTTTGDMWSKLKAIEGRNTIIPPHPDPQGEANRLINNYANRAKSSQLPDEAQDEQIQLHDIRAEELQCNVDLPDNDTDRDFSIFELCAALEPKRTPLRERMDLYLGSLSTHPLPLKYAYYGYSIFLGLKVNSPLSGKVLSYTAFQNRLTPKIQGQSPSCQLLTNSWNPWSYPGCCGGQAYHMTTSGAFPGADLLTTVFQHF